MWKFFSFSLLLALSTYLGMTGCAVPQRNVDSHWLPGDGDAQRGQQTFRDMGCFTCHATPDPTMPSPITTSRYRIPLTEQIRRMESHLLVAAIISPLHLTPKTEEARPVGDYADVLTVQQLRDLVTYLKEL